MSPIALAAYESLQQHVTTLLLQVETESHILPAHLMWAIHASIIQISCTLRRNHNASQPLFRLPVEVLHQIVEFSIPMKPSTYPLLLKSSIRDSCSVLPLSHTCHQLRAMILSHRLLWRDVNGDKLSITRLLDRNANGLPLRVRSLFSNHTPGTLSAITSPLQELHLAEIHDPHLQDVNTLLSYPHPALRSLSLGFVSSPRWRKTRKNLCLSPAHFPELRRLSLLVAPFQIVGTFEWLTHLALYDITRDDLHAGVVEFITQCPSLLHLALGGPLGVQQPAELPSTVGIAVPAIQQVTLHGFDAATVQFYVTLLSHADGPSFHVIGFSGNDTSFTSSFLFPADAPDVTRLSFALHPDREGRFCQYEHSLSLTTAGPALTRRLATYGGSLYLRGLPSWMWHSHCIDPALAPGFNTIREVWFENTQSSYPWSRSGMPPYASTHTLFPPSVEEVVLVVDRSLLPFETPSLHVLPRADDRTFACPRLKIVRIAHGHPRDAHPPSPAVTALDFGPMFRDLASGAYRYLERLVLQTTPLVQVADVDLARLREHFVSVQHERVAELPRMEIRGGESAEWRCESWPGALW
ncbi:uncharacterized protein BXZ73DRAFT_105534 [Epithele typhae]|uniref:uncharacterized protein n=1 Tax=Epithele typhae TaxID=378194 RepID=UPI002008CCCB|nr:uncharacterized protein BXZ73DRAFT_105534 [Epithele typhae]KAH9917372.1 hypothetical protein BXZ73DRAFT_105534 [Epithele typhae]